MPHKESVLLEMISTLGKLPERWWYKWEYRSQYFSSDGAPTRNIIEMDPQGPRRLALRVQQMRLGWGEQSEEAPKSFNAQDLASLEKLLASMLRYEPSERATTEDVVQLEWVQQLLREAGMR